MIPNAFGRGAVTQGHMPSSLHEMDPLAGSANHLALDEMGVPPAEMNAALVLLDRLNKSGREREVLVALLALSFVHEITPLVDSALPDQKGAKVDESTAALSALTGEVGLMACDPSVPHSNPAKIRSTHDRWHAIGHPAASSMMVTAQGLSTSVATIVGNRHRHGPDVAHGTGGLTLDLRSTSDVSAAALELADLALSDAPESESALTARSIRRLFDDSEVYGTRGSQLVDALRERFGLPDVGVDSVRPPTLGVGIINTSGGLSRIAIRPDMGDSNEHMFLPFHANHFDGTSNSQEDILGTIVSRAIGVSS